jgi:hypothetical protein
MPERLQVLVCSAAAAILPESPAVAPEQIRTMIRIGLVLVLVESARGDTPRCTRTTADSRSARRSVELVLMRSRRLPCVLKAAQVGREARANCVERAGRPSAERAESSSSGRGVRRCRAASDELPAQMNGQAPLAG